jgi:hypothetical protein
MSSPATKLRKTHDGKPTVETELAPPEHEEIALLAYMYWEARGRPADSPEEDWFRAEEEIRRATRS